MNNNGLVNIRSNIRKDVVLDTLEVHSRRAWKPSLSSDCNV